jgi:hypothetical protein
LALDCQLGLGGFGVEDDDFADAGGDEGFFGHVQAAQDGEEFALDLVVGQCGVGVGGLEEEAHGFENVDVGVDDAGAECVPVEQLDH